MVVYFGLLAVGSPLIPVLSRSFMVSLRVVPSTSGCINTAGKILCHTHKIDTKNTFSCCLRLIEENFVAFSFGNPFLYRLNRNPLII